MKDEFELPGQHYFRMDFISKYKNKSSNSNMEALSHCYANYKVFGVQYPPEIMQKIYDFDKQFGYKIKDEEIDILKVSDEKSTVQTKTSFYKPINFNSAQDAAGFSFINFVKSDGCSEKPLLDNIVVKKIKEIEIVKKPYIPRIIPDPNFMKFEDALRNSEIKDKLLKFQSMYIEMKGNDGSLSPTDVILHSISASCDLSLDFKFKFDRRIFRCNCKMVLNDLVLIGEGVGPTNIVATEEALRNAHETFTKGSTVCKKFQEDIQCFPPEEVSDNDLDIIPDGVEIFDLDILNDFYIKNNRSDASNAVLLEAFQFFRFYMQFKQLEDMVLLFLNDSVLACMPLEGSFLKTKTLLAHYVLKHLESTKWTMMKNEVDLVENAVEKTKMYDPNTQDPDKIKTSMNIGGQLMLKMGWDEESGLGKMGTGRKDPIINERRGGRNGLGFNFGPSTDTKSFSNNVSQFLRQWLNEDRDEITFDSHFDNKERAIIHKECRKLGITSKSYNNSVGERFLMVSKTRTPRELFDWVQSQGGKSRLYTLLPPGYRKLHLKPC